MRILFLHQNFPAQFRHVAAAIAKDNRNQVVFGTNRRDGSLPGITKTIYSPKREASPETHHYVRPLENAVIQGQAVYRMAEQLKAQGFVPDVVYGHSGWGPTLLMKDIFPKAKLLCYFEWFYHAHGTDADFDPNEPLTADDVARIRLKNAPILVDLYSCDRGLSPTYWQRQQFPSEYQDKIKVLHDGIDTNFFCPKPGAKLVLPRINLDLSHVEELVTYVGRGMEPYRGFPQFIEAIYLLQQRRPQCHVVIVGEDRVAYGKTLPDGKTYKQVMLEKFPLDLSRVHFTGHLPYPEYLQVLQASSVHVYLTRPFVLSWSLLESLSTGCLVVGSNTAPVAEVIQDGVNGLLAEFFSPEEIAERIAEALNHPDKMSQIRTKARQTILENYDLSLLLPQHLDWIGQGIGGSSAPLWMKMQSKSANKSEKNGSKGKQVNSQLVTKAEQPVLQIGDRTVTGTELAALLQQYQLLPKLQEEMVIEQAIASFTCTPEEEAECCEYFYKQRQLNTEVARQKWLQEQGMTPAQLINLATRELKIEKFKQATWADKLESYFLQQKIQLDQYVYSLIRLRDGDVAQELYFRLKEGEQTFAEIAQKYSEGLETKTGGLIGPVPLGLSHPKLAQILKASQPGQLIPPTAIEDLWIIVRLEKVIPAQFDEAMQQKLLDELFANWLKQQLKKPAALQLAAS
ncbi:MAG TPA: group 1 glycosyl transferase [Cyanobacteria bacterium UBA11372]|nr:group 1 glycosyl transferase [Cyanobacteria bacterium UBA11372]